MWNNYIGHEIRRCNRNLLITNLLLFAALSAAGWYFHQEIRGWVRGASYVEASALVADPKAFADKRVALDAVEVTPSGYRATELDKSGKSEAVEYLLATVDGKRLAVRVPRGRIAVKLDGTLVPLPDDARSGIRTQMLSAAPKPIRARNGRAAVPDPTANLLPFMLDTTPYQDLWGWAWLGLGALVAFGGMVGLVTWLRRSIDYDAHPMVARLGGISGVRRFGAQLDRELATRSMRFGPVTLTDSWIIRPEAYTTRLLRYEDVVWLYKHRTWFGVYGVPAFRLSAAMLWGRDGRLLEVHMWGRTADQMLATIMQMAPWAQAGYSDDLMQSWRQDRGAVIRDAQGRRAVMQQHEKRAA
jgi:hypothetical protein